MSRLPSSVTIDDVELAIVDETYTVLPNGRTTICQLTLYNGFTVEGSSACVSKENFDPVKGNKFSREKALDKVWAHLGFRLADQLHQAAMSEPQPADPVTSFRPNEDRAVVGLGDQVLYFEQVGDKLSEPMLATVASVLPHNHVALSVLAPNGTSHARNSVPMTYDAAFNPSTPCFARPRH